MVSNGDIELLIDKVASGEGFEITDPKFDASLYHSLQIRYQNLKKKCLVKKNKHPKGRFGLRKKKSTFKVQQPFFLTALTYNKF